MGGCKSLRLGLGGTAMPGLLDGKTALVTGAAGGIGLAVAQAYVEHGARVALADVQAGPTQAAADALCAARPGSAVALALDVTEEAATEAAVAACVRQFGRLDIAVANAGVLALRPAVELSVADWNRVLAVNLTGAFVTARAAAAQMLRQAGGGPIQGGPVQGGRILFTSSLFGLRGGVENAAYSASKFGMIGLMQSMAAELAPSGILVNAVCPGQMDTAMIRQLFAERAALRGVPEAEVRGALERRIPVGHLGPLDQLAGTYVYLASELGRYVTGQSIAVDGGWQVG